ncbi:hypothetical protein HY797_00370 [Candidatus Falkowbacteria bacterium]|nr:hypothetical protein [Candidatus Falkowbacteria bacterium]
MLEDEQFNEAGGGFEEKPDQSPPPLNKNQKIAAASLAVFAVFILVLWFAQLRSNIYGPFNASSGKNQVASEAENSDEALKSKDTDADGLTDYDELNIYKTSPYLEDSDSDGFKDGEEIKKDFDPNCPQGRTCSGGLLDNSAADQTATDETLNSLLNQFGTSQAETQADSAANLTSDQLNALKNIDAASLRQLLLQAGMPKETLDKISDTDLMKSYSETLNSGQ